MKLTRANRKGAIRHGEAVILFNLANTAFAIAANSVEEIRALDGLRPVPPGFAHSRYPKVKHLVEREGKTYFVVEANLHFKILPSKATRVLLLRASDVAVLVDGIDRMAEISVLHALPHAFEGEERFWYRGLALIGEQVVPVVNPDCFVSKTELSMLRSSLAQLAAAAEVAAKGASA